jgi:hypothetical protein
MKILYQNVKLSQMYKKLQNYRNERVQRVGRMDREGLPYLIMKYQPSGKHIQGRPLKTLLDY